jgi:DNA ligase-1
MSVLRDLDLQIAEMYERQVLAQGNGKKRKGGEDDDGFW